MLMELLITATTCLSIKWLTPSNAGGDYDRENFDSSTPFFDPDSVNDSNPLFDPLVSSPTIVVGRPDGGGYADPYELNDSYYHPFPFDLTPDCAFENQSYSVITNGCSLSQYDDDWFSFSILSDSKVTISLFLESDGLEIDYSLELYSVYLWDREPGLQTIKNHRKLAGVYTGNDDYSDTFYLKAGSYLVHIGYSDFYSNAPYLPSFNYEVEVDCQYLVRDDLNIYYAKNFLECGAAYWEADYFPFNLYDVYFNGYFDQVTAPYSLEHLYPDEATDLIPQRVWGDDPDRPAAPQTLAFIWSNDLKNSFASILESLVSELSAKQSQISSDLATFNVSFTIVNEITANLVSLLPLGNVVELVINTSFELVGELFKGMLENEEMSVSYLLDYFSDLLNLTRVHINPDASDETHGFNGEILVVPTEILGYDHGGDNTGAVSFFRPMPLPGGDNYFLTDSVVESFPENAISRGNIWLALDDASLFSRENLTVSPSYSYEGRTIQELRSGHDFAATDVLKDQPVSIPPIAEPYKHYMFKFTAPKTGIYSFDLNGYYESIAVCADLSYEWPDTTDCSSLAVPHYQHIMGDIKDYPEFTTKNVGTLALNKGRTVYIRFHGPDWESWTGRNGIMPTLTISEIPHLEHDYSSRYEDFDSTMHKSYCACGDYVLEPHDYSVAGNPYKQGYSCTRCGHSRLTVIKPLDQTV